MGAPKLAACVHTLAEFQDDFARALLGDDAFVMGQVAALSAQPAFAVYRNTAMKGCVDALQANYPAVARLVGEEWFRAAARIYVRAALPASPMLLDYGAGFADFLERFEPAKALPYLADVARLDRFWSEAHAAPTQAALDPASLGALAPDTLAATVLHPHAAARWAWFDAGPAYTIWSQNRALGPPDAEFEWRAEGALLLRPRDAVQWIALDAASCAFLDACAAGAALGEAAQSALAAQSDVDLARLLSALLVAGAFSHTSHIDETGVKEPSTCLR